ncbi:MAG: hypothetical protein CML87_00365 [Rhodobiaceae bacterium]|jgi:cytoplasmic iron level regulating protein YaaA (DUF328/UPF0246 family)|nr:hypothetical protein [Rhodobiaceae bacterium]|tara:strand:+ start:269 stop:1039 length:771 start_codon:yes stop_codon:yes gene_type:complete
MLILLSPAKTLDYEAKINDLPYTSPHFLTQSKSLMKNLKNLKRNEITKMMKLSDKLTELNINRYKHWSGKQMPSENARQSVFVFKGDVYKGLKAENFSKNDLEFAQNHLRMLSGLYGILKPLDVIEPYRLEMGTKLKNNKGSSLYDFWGKKITENLIKDLESMNSKTLINLASNEYFNSVQSLPKEVNLISPVFKDSKNGQFKIISFYAKIARGLMAAWIIKNKIKNEKYLPDFSEEGYKFSMEESAKGSPVFLRG